MMITVSLMFASCSHQAVRPVQTGALSIDSGSFASEVTGYGGFALVLFYNNQYVQSQDMDKRFEHFAQKYGESAKFCRFHWQIGADERPYALEMLPTVVLYKGGIEIDRIWGIPLEEKDLLKFNDDIDLWLMKNVLGLEGGKYCGKFRYLFVNGYTLNVSNY